MLVIISSTDAFGEDTSSYFHCKVIKISGNKRTRPHIIERELAIKLNETVDTVTLQRVLLKSHQNLLNLYLFNKVIVSASHDTFYVRVYERWYFWPVPEFKIVDRNFNVWWQTKDLSRTFYGINFTNSNFRGRNETVKLLLTTGYTRKAFLEYRIPNLNKKQNIGIKITGGALMNREVWIRTFEDKVDFYDQNAFVIKQYDGQIALRYRPKIYYWHEFTPGFKLTELEGPEVQMVNPLFLLGNIQKEYFLNYKFVVDRRNYKGYATKGMYWQNESEIEKLSSSQKSLVNLTLKSRISGYMDFGQNFYVAASTAFKWSSNTRLPYTNNKSFGYGYDYVRGYELYVVDGPHFSLTKLSVKYRFLNGSVKVPYKIFANVKTMPCWGYITLFTDAGYVNNSVLYDYNQLPNQWLHGYGVSLDGVLFHDRIMRIEYTINKHGQKGLYVHFINSI